MIHDLSKQIEDIERQIAETYDKPGQQNVRKQLWKMRAALLWMKEKGKK